MAGDNSGVVVEDHEPGASGPLVDRSDELVHLGRPLSSVPAFGSLVPALGPSVPLPLCKRRLLMVGKR
jgi:hypothetical protein